VILTETMRKAIVENAEREHFSDYYGLYACPATSINPESCDCGKAEAEAALAEINDLEAPVLPILCGMPNRIDEGMSCVLDANHSRRREWHLDARGTQWTGVHECGGCGHVAHRGGRCRSVAIDGGPCVCGTGMPGTTEPT
jgi:hypothetical protein